MKRSASAQHMFKKAQAHLRRAAVRRGLSDVTTGGSRTLAIDLDEKSIDVVGIVGKFASRLRPGGQPMRRLLAAFKQSGATAAAIDGLGSRDPAVRRASARMLGALQIEEASVWLAPLVSSRDSLTADAAARALGRIGGVRAADALLLAIQRVGPRRVLIVELARAAPDLYLESILGGPPRPAVQSAVAVAAGLRRRHVAVAPLLALLVRGTRQQRIVSCRALGWIGSWTAIPLIEAALDDREWKVRMSAAKALHSLHVRLSSHQVDALLADRHHRVRKEGLTMLRRVL